MVSTPAPLRAPIRRRVLVLAVVLLGAIVLNLAQFRVIDADGPPEFAALHRGETSDLLEMAYEECPWCRDRYSLHIALRVIAPGSRVVVAGPGELTMPSPWDDPHDAAEELTVRLLAFGAADQVDWIPAGWVRDRSAPALAAGIDPVPFIVATGEGGEKGAPWAIAADPARFDSETVPEPAHFLEAALAAGEHRGSDQPPGEFLLLRWELPRPGTGYSYQDLLVELTLLPEHLQERL